MDTFERVALLALVLTAVIVGISLGGSAVHDHLLAHTFTALDSAAVLHR